MANSPFRITSILALSLWCSQLQADPLLELVTANGHFQGRNSAHNQEVCWLTEPRGGLLRIPLSDVTSFRKVGVDFVPSSPAAVANELRPGLGREMEVQVRGPFVVVAPQGTARLYADVAERVNQSFQGYFSRRSWKLNRIEFPLVIMVCPTRDNFDQVCRAGGMMPSPLLQGFYHPQSNRVTMFHLDDAGTTSAGVGSGLAESLRKTLIHETIHQLAFNSGLHSRMAGNPRWVVEGLAVVMETGALESAVANGAQDRINRNRLDHFLQYRQTRRQGTIAEYISGDERLYISQPLDFYSEAWALTFYLSEQRRPEYLQYLKRLAARSPLQEPPTPEERIEEFQSVFGKDLKWVEVQFQRFIDGLEPR